MAKIFVLVDYVNRAANCYGFAIACCSQPLILQCSALFLLLFFFFCFVCLLLLLTDVSLLLTLGLDATDRSVEGLAALCKGDDIKEILLVWKQWIM